MNRPEQRPAPETRDQRRETPPPTGSEQQRIYREPGYVFTPLRRGADRAGAVLVVADSREEALARAEDAANRVRFVTADAGALV